jgi:hypothetical protein
MMLCEGRLPIDNYQHTVVVGISEALSMVKHKEGWNIVVISGIASVFIA